MAESPPFNPDTASGPRFSVSFEYTDDLLMRVYRPVYIKTAVLWGWYIFIACSFLGLISSSDWDSGLRGLLIVMTTYTLIAIIHFRGSFLSRSLWFSRMEHRRWDCEFDDYGVHYVFAIGAARLKWTMFTSLKRKRRLWLLRMGEKGALPVPVPLMSPALQEFILRKAHENRLEVR